MVNNSYVTWKDGSCRLHLISHHPGRGVVLVIPSLINRANIFLLGEGGGLVNFLSDKVSVYLLEWDDPCDLELHFTIEDYLISHLIPALRHIYNITNTKPILIGYCMGGVFAIAVSLIFKYIDKLCLLATPWDFCYCKKLADAVVPGTLELFTKMPFVPHNLIYSMFAFFTD